MAADLATRTKSFGEDHSLSPVDRFGTWLSERGLHRHVGDWAGKRVADVGCGHAARLTTKRLDSIAHLTVVDVSLSESLKKLANVTAVEGGLPAALASIPDASIDITLCMSVLEHLWDDRSTLGELRRITAPGGMVVVNVPTWLGKRALEFSAFRLGLSPRAEIDDHKRYYDPRDLWPLLIEAGFVPSLITCRRHKFGLNTLAACRVPTDMRSW